MFVILFCFILSNYVAYYYLNALSGWGSISTEVNNLFRRILCSVSMPSRAGTPFLHIYGNCYFSNSIILYQCPFGLKLHFYVDAEDAEKIKYLSYQCPFRLKLHFYKMKNIFLMLYFLVSMPFQAKAPFLLLKKQNLKFV